MTPGASNIPDRRGPIRQQTTNVLDASRLDVAELVAVEKALKATVG